MSDVMTVEEARKVEPVTPAEAELAEREAAEAADLVAALEERVREGAEDISPQEITVQRELAGFAKLRAEATARKVERSRQAERLRVLGDLADAMRARSTTDGATYLGLLTTIEQAVTDLITYSRDRDQTLDAWRLTMHNQGVPYGAGGHGFVQPEHQGRIGWGEGPGRPVFVDGERLEHVEPGSIVLAALHRAMTQTGHVLRTGDGGSPIKLPTIYDGWLTNAQAEIDKAT